MSQHQLRIIVKRRKEIDLDKLAAALLDYVDGLSEADLERLANSDEPATKKRKEQP